MLDPVFVCPDPIRGGAHKLVLCQVLYTDMTPHATNTRAPLAAAAERFAHCDAWYGMEQEYTFFEGNTPLGWPRAGFPGPQGPYYCGVGANSAYGRDIVEAHMEACLAAGLGYSGLNAEVMPGQWEFQIGPVGPLAIGDQLTVARWLLKRVAEDHGVEVSFDPKPVKGDWNGAGCHTNFSTAAMREGYDAIVAACEALGEKAAYHVASYGDGIEHRLTGSHETCSYKEFKYGVSDRSASVRIPWQVAVDQRGYLEDRRPNANCDPYRVAQVMLETICGC